MDIVSIALAVLGIGYVLARRVVGDLVEVRSLLLLPAVLTVIGVVQLRDAGPPSLALVGFVAAGIVLSVVIGLVRGTTVHLGRRGQELWMRYRAATVGLWVLNLALKVAMIPVERLISRDAADAANHAILLSIGLGILAESAVVLLRAMRREGVVVWRKGEDGAPHQTSPAFEKARAHVRSGDAAGGLRLPRRDW